MLLLSDSYAFYGCGARALGGCSYLIDSGCLCFGLLAGGRPAATHFLLLRQKKVSKEKATRLSGSLRFASGNLRCPEKTGVGANSLHYVTLKQRAALIPFLRDSAGPDRTGKSGNECRAAGTLNRYNTHVLVAIDTINLIADSARTTCAKGTFDTKTPLHASVSAPAPAPASAPVYPVLAGPLSARKNGIRAARCLSRRRVCADPRFFWRSKVARSEAQGPRQPGRLSFAYFSLAKQRKVSRRRAIPGQQASAKSPVPISRTNWGKLSPNAGRNMSA